MADQQASNPFPPASGFTTIGNELDPTAPLWRVYRDEVRNHDRDVTLDEWNKTLDILLIFAGLFSAVVTSFLVASYPLLTPEDGNTSVVNAIQALALAINSSITLPTPQPPVPVTASTLWVNGLWFTSLFIGIAVAFFAILAKQWLVEYNHRMADPPTAVAASLSPAILSDNETPPASVTIDRAPTASLAWARRRQFFFSAFANWHIPVLITQVLPFLLHVALFLFLTGLSVFVWTLNGRIACIMTALTALLFGLYVIATIMPLLRVECPTATPLIRRVREAPTWIVIKTVQLWNIILRIVLRASGPSCVTLRDVGRTLDELRLRQKRIRDSNWLDSEGTTDYEVKLDTLRWLILISGSETAITTAFQALGALPADSPFLPALRTITAGMDTPIERLGNSQTPPTAVEIIRAVRSELILGRGSWSLPLLGLDLSPAFIQTLQESKHPDTRLLFAAMHLRDDLCGWPEPRPFPHLYDITDTFLRERCSSVSCISTVRLLLNCPSIYVSAFACLAVLLARSLRLDNSDRALIFRVFALLRGKWSTCDVYENPHACNGLCLVVFTVCRLDRHDPYHIRIIPIVLSHLLPTLMPDLSYGAEGLVPLSIFRDARFSGAIYLSDWLHSPCPDGNTDIGIISTLLDRFDWSHGLNRHVYMKILEWFVSRAQYKTLCSPSVIAKIRDTLTRGGSLGRSLLNGCCRIVYRIKPDHTVSSIHRRYHESLIIVDKYDGLPEFISSLILLCQDLSPYGDKLYRDAVFKQGLIPEIGACLERMQSTESSLVDVNKEFFHMVNAALPFLVVGVKKEEKDLLHLAQHCVALDPSWTQREEVGACLDARLMEELLVQDGPCTVCSEGSGDEWPAGFIKLRHPTSPSDEQDPQTGVPSHAAASSSLAASNPGSPLMSAALLDASSPPADAVTAHAATVSPIASVPIPIRHAATGLEPVASRVASGPGNAMLSAPLADVARPSAAAPEETPVDALQLIIGTSLSPTATSRATTALTRAHVTPTSPAALDDLGSAVISHQEAAPRGGETSDPQSIAPHRLASHVEPLLDAMEIPEAETLSPIVTIPGAEVATTLPASVALDSETASSVGQYHYEPVIQAPHSRIASTVSSLADVAQSVGAVGLATFTAATGLLSESALDVTAVTAARDSPPRSEIESTPDAAETNIPSPYLPLARTVNVPTTSTSSSDSESPEDGVDGRGATGSSVG